MKKTNAVSSVVGMILILAVLATIIISITVYKLPILEKRSEYQQEVKKLNSFSKLLGIYIGKNETLQLNLGACNTIVQVCEDSTINVRKVGEMGVTLNITSGNKTLNKTVYGRFFAVNLSVYPSKLPYIVASLSEGGLTFFQSGTFVIVNSPYNYINQSILTSNNSVLIYVDNFKISGYKEITGNGFSAISILVSRKKINFSNVNCISINVSGYLKNYWKKVLISRGFTNVSYQYVYRFTKPGEVTIVHRNYSICIW